MATIKGSARGETLRGTTNPDTILAGAGDDYVYGMPDDTKIDGGSGYDTLDLSGASAALRYSRSACEVSYWPDAATKVLVLNFERVVGSGYDDYVFGGTGAETLVGNGGNDTFEGGAGNDTFIGDFLAGTTSAGAAGSDVFQFTTSDSGNDRILDFQYGSDHLMFYGIAQPGRISPTTDGKGLIVYYGASSTVTLLGLGGLSPDSYAGLFTYENGGIVVPH